MKLKVLSYNIHKGFSTTNRKFVLKGIKDAIQETGAEIVFLQEVVGSNSSKKHIIDDWHNQAQFEYLSNELFEHHVYGKNSVYTKGDHGNAILSKYPVSFSENIDISTNPFEKRGILHTVIEVNDKKVHALCLHLNLLESGRKVQIEKLCTRINSHVNESEPILLAGDFNDWRTNISDVLEENVSLKDAHLTKHGVHAKTFPSASPFLSLDRIYFRGIQIESVEVKSDGNWKKLSDHVALFATFDLM
ncbi:MAG: endonuclease/exonuclease/phosphatase family protein [Candidatus Sericytochromatia bacterium]